MLEPLATASSNAEVAWLRVQLQRGRAAKQELYVASVYMPDSGKADAVISDAWEVLQDIVAVRVAKGHSYLLLGDFNARVGSATTPDQRLGQHGEHGPPNLAGRALIGLLAASDSCILNSRSPGDNITFNCGDRPRSILD